MTEKITTTEELTPAVTSSATSPTKYIVKSKSRYLRLMNGDGSPFPGRSISWDTQVLRSARRSDATEFDSLEQAFEAKSVICSSCLVSRAFWPDQIAVVDVKTGKEVEGFREWQSKRGVGCSLALGGQR